MSIGSVAVAIAMATLMFYTGLMFDPALLRARFNRHDLREFARLAIVNCVLIPIAALCLIRFGAMTPTMNLVLLTLAMLPCAPLVPALTSMTGEPAEWPLFVFLNLSVLSLIQVPLLMVLLALPWVAGDAMSPQGGAGAALIRYFASVYGPMSAGAAIRLFAPSRFHVLMNLLRRAMPAVMAASVVLFAISHYDEILALGWREYGALLLFELICIAIALAFASRDRDRKAAGVLISAFRNVAMGIAFATMVFPHTAATSYLMTFTTLLFLATVLFVTIDRRRKAAVGCIARDAK